jgi:thiamine biosynthesis protein ThiS
MKSEMISIMANGKVRQTAAGFTVADFVTSSGWQPGQVVIELNGEIVSKINARNVMLHEGDRLEIIIPVAGG